MRLALGCVLLLPAALHLLLCHAPAAAATADTDTFTDTRHPTPLPPLHRQRHTRHDPLHGRGLFAGLPRLLSLTSQDTPLSYQPLDILYLTLMQRHPTGSLTPLANPLQRAAMLPSTQNLQEVGSFPLNDFELNQLLLEGLDGIYGRRQGGSRAEAGRGDSCRGHLAPEDTFCPSTLMQILSGQASRAREVHPPFRRPRVVPAAPLAFSASPWLKAPPSKRYLGIELPDYIATSYSSIKTDNAHYLTKLHQLKQRMRNAGK